MPVTPVILDSGPTSTPTFYLRIGHGWPPRPLTHYQDNKFAATAFGTPAGDRVPLSRVEARSQWRFLKFAGSYRGWRLYFISSDETPSTSGRPEIPLNSEIPLSNLQSRFEQREALGRSQLDENDSESNGPSIAVIGWQRRSPLRSASILRPATANATMARSALKLLRTKGSQLIIGRDVAISLMAEVRASRDTWIDWTPPPTSSLFLGPCLDRGKRLRATFRSTMSHDVRLGSTGGGFRVTQNFCLLCN